MFLDLLNLRVSQMIVDYSGELQLKLIESLQAFLLSPGESLQPAVDRLKNAASAVAYPIFGALLLTGISFAIILHHRLPKRNSEKMLLRSF